MSELNINIMVMKKCFKFSTWEEQEDFIMSVNESYIAFVEEERYNITRHEFGEMCSTRTKVEKIKQSTPRDLILQKLCELTGAKMYGDYVVFTEVDGFSGISTKSAIVYFKTYYTFLCGENAWNECKKLLEI